MDRGKKEENDMFVWAKEGNRTKIYEKVRSQVHPDVYHLRRVNLECKEKMPRDDSLERRSKEIEGKKEENGNGSQMNEKKCA